MRSIMHDKGVMVNSFPQIINQKVDADSYQGNGVKNTKGDKCVSIGNASINDENNNHSVKQSRKKSFLSVCTHIPTLHTKDIIDDFKSILEWLATKCK